MFYSFFSQPLMKPPPEGKVPARAWLLRAGPYVSLLLGFSAIFLIWFGAIYFSHLEWLQTEDAAHRTGENLAKAFEEQIIRTVRAADETLLYARDLYVRDPGHFSIALWQQDIKLISGAESQIAIIDSTGHLVMSTLPDAPVGLDLSDREHFQIQAGQQKDELFISKPVIGRVSHRWSIQLTRRIVTEGGNFGGVAVVSLDPDYISEFYESIDLGKLGVVALVGTDGIIRARRSGGASAVGTSLARGRVFDELKKSPSGFYTTTSLTDGVERIFAYRKVKDYPLIITVGLATGEVFATYAQNRRTHIVVGSLLTLWLFLGTAIMARYQRQLAGARDAAETGTRARSEFLAMMSHEIRTPMNGVIGMADLLLESGLSGEQMRYAGTLRESATHLLKIINDVLDFSKLEAGRIQTEKIPFKLHSLVRSTVGLLDAYAKERNLDLTVNIAPNVPEAIVGDPGRLRQVLLNFVGNALKFTKTGGVTVTIAIESPAGRKRLAFSIADTGIGIPPDAIPLLFREFSQLDSSIARRFGGTGLGLAICKRLIGIMGGTVSVESTVGKGTTFKFTIDYVPSSPDVVEPEWGQKPLLKVSVSSVRSSEQLHVLLVEDNKTNQLVATKLIESLGHTVDVADNGAEALTACQTIRYDAIFMDVMMPGMDGLAVTRVIRKLKPPFCDVHIIALTANVQTQHIQECRDAGMDDFLPKPVSRNEIAAKLATVHHAVPATSLVPSQPATVEQVPPDTVAFDRSIYDTLADGLGPDGIREVLEQFLADCLGRIEIMRGAAARDDFAAIELEAHSSKSAAASLGFLRLSELSRDLERDAGNRNVPHLPGRVAEFARQFAEVETIARDLLARPAEAPVA